MIDRYTRASSATRRPTIRVVIADNQIVARLGIHQLLEQAPGISVVGEAGSGFEALRLTRELAPDVLVLEIRMPDLSGIELVQALSEASRPSRILVLSAYDDEAYVRQLLSGAVTGYLRKSDTSAHLLEAIYGVARGEEGWVSPSVARKLLHLRKQEAALEGYRLTTREQEALAALARGFKNSEIADTLCLSVGTVKNHLTNIYEKLGVTSRAEAIVWAYDKGLR